MKTYSELERSVMRLAAFLLLLSLTVWNSPAVGDMPEVGVTPPGVVYAKVILPMEAAARGEHFAVESWIAKRLRKRGEAELRAVTGWVRLAEKGEDVADLWNATVDGKAWGCRVDGAVAKRTADGKVKVSLSGWSPVGAQIKGKTLPAETGSRRIAVVDTGGVDRSADAYVALLVGPAPPAAELRHASED